MLQEQAQKGSTNFLARYSIRSLSDRWWKRENAQNGTTFDCTPDAVI